ncbi:MULTISPECIES: DUF1254 domain-containing protein [Flavobacterium]|uniref:DUF1254 multi-domain protein n=1 Tax=Flavobacterium anhuiense TaxID=459526 RepID=A0A444VZF2_9FLAO|nr:MULTISPECIES: DUF1254 domain-containing protein [Flavobacterium]EJF99009.1 hypothetical protein FF52_22934 [Flavobacterium sp. F52]RYJ38862.1 DUF1254 multi-domain protein [Flavobacterium anhuiense]
MKRSLLLFAAFLLFISCKKETTTTQNALSAEEAKSIAKEAYIYGYPMLMGYRALYASTVDKKSPAYRSGFNIITHDRRPADDTRKDVVSMNADTPYSLFALDLRAEPIVLSVPAIKDRYYVFQFTDLFTHNFAYVGTRSTGSEAGDYLFVGPDYKGEIPKGKFKKVFNVESQLAIGIGRTQLLGSKDLANVIQIQDKYKVTSLSQFLGTASPKKASEINWIAFNPKDIEDANFIKYMNVYLDLVKPFNKEDVEDLAKFEKIGIKAGADFDSSQLNEETLKAINDGVQEGITAIKEKAAHISEQKNGWNMMDPFGNREFYKKDHLLRAAAVMVGIYGNDKIEAFYPVVYNDKEGQTLNGKTNKYKIHFSKDEIPPAKYFWSITMYDKSADGTGGYLIKNPINRFLINSTTEGLVYDKDGGLTIYIQNQKPDKSLEANWLPAPAEEFYLMTRIYGPKESALNGTWSPPAIEKVN